VIAIDDIPVDTRWDVQELLTRLHPGMEVSVTVVKRHSGDRDEANVVLR
jgi:S1-C subfamily serine protease